MDRLLAGHYELVKHLGGGGFGQTFLARDSHLPGKPLCVVKQLKPATKDPASLTVAKRLFDREAETLYRLGSHDQIPRLLAHFEQNQQFYLVQEFIAGQPLDKEFTAGKKLNEAEVIDLLQDIMQVLAFVHRQHVIHRDIKPANLIRRSKDNKIVLIDFGAVKEVSSQTVVASGETSMTVAVGSPGYMPSEQQAFHPRYSSDIYAVGIVCMQALSGLQPKQLPIDPMTGEFCCKRLCERASISPEFAEILDRMVRYDYRQRYENAIVALQALREFLGTEDQISSNTETMVVSNPFQDQTEAISEQLFTPTVAPSGPPSSPQSLSDDVKKQLERLLAESIGPIAAVILRSALLAADSFDDLIERLASHVPDGGRSLFKKQAQMLLHNPNNSSITTFQSHPFTKASAGVPRINSELTPSFVKRCEQELLQAIGPIAPLLVQRTLSRNPRLSAIEFIDALGQHLRDPKAVETFRRKLLTLL
jgi:serine/threonine protein kinase